MDTERVATVLGGPEGKWKADSLVGSFCLTGHERGWQGCVVAEPAPSVYLVLTFSWIDGCQHTQHLVPIDEMLDEGWTFFDDSESMQEAYSRFMDSQWQDARREAREAP